MISLDDQTIELAKTLMAQPSVSPDDAGCQAILIEQLTEMGFAVRNLPFNNVSNLWATRAGTSDGRLFAFAGHTDVVPTGPREDWSTDPFTPTVIDGMLFGRGAADMKGSIAAMLTGIRRFLSNHNDYSGTIGLLITSDEEADAIDGTVRVIETLENEGTHIDWCVVGEPSSSQVIGDVVRVGRRGSLNGVLRVNGQQGHVAYPDKAKNPIHEAAAALTEFTSSNWDNGNEYFPPTSMQISNIHSGTGVNNVIPGEMLVTFNFRFSTDSTEASLKQRTHEIFDRHGLDCEIDWALSGHPFITEGGELIPAVQAVLGRVDVQPELSTSGGTSDGRFIAPYGTQVVELGPCNATIHKVDECVAVTELQQLSRVYTDLLQELLTA